MCRYLKFHFLRTFLVLYRNMNSFTPGRVVATAPCVRSIQCSWECPWKVQSWGLAPAIKYQFRFPWCCHHWEQLSTGRGSEANGCSVPRCQGKFCLLLNWKHYHGGGTKMTSITTSPLVIKACMFWKKSPHSLSGFPLLDILADPSSFLYLFIFLGNASSSLASDLGTISSKEELLLWFPQVKLVRSVSCKFFWQPLLLCHRIYRITVVLQQTATWGACWDKDSQTSPPKASVSAGVGCGQGLVFFNKYSRCFGHR